MPDKLASLALPDGSFTETTDAPLPGADMRPHRRTFLTRRIEKKPIAKPSGGGSDWAIMLGGIGLATVCALFPWYIFLNQDEFGIRPLAFEGRPPDEGPPPAFLPELVGMRIPQSMIDLPQLDYSATGTVSAEPLEPVPEQPFPGDAHGFRLVYAANGRAMIEDKDGYWIVQRGSSLPDGSRVSRIQNNKGQWEIVTTRDAVIAATGDEPADTQGPRKTGLLR